MKITIRFSESEEARALPILYRQFTGMVLPQRVYVLDDTTVVALRKAGIEFEELAAEGAAPTFAGATAGERI